MAWNASYYLSGKATVISFLLKGILKAKKKKNGKHKNTTFNKVKNIEKYKT